MVKINTFSLFYIISVGLLIGAMLSLSPKVYANNEKLEQIQKEIENHKKLIEKKQNDFNELKKQLEKDQEEFHQISEQLKRSKQKLSDTKDQIKKLEKEQLDLLEKKDNQLQILKIQLSEAYKLGKNDYIKLILNQQNPNQIGRILEYYHYISVARIEIIKEIDTISNLIRQNHEELVKNNQKLQQIVKEHNNNADQYKIKQKKTTETLIAINKSIQNEEQTLKNLKKAEQNLLNSIAENQRLLEEKRKNKLKKN